MKKTVLKNMMNVLTCSVLLGGALGAHQAVAALSGSTGDMVGFTATQDQYWTAPGDQVEFKLRLGGTFTASITNTFWAYPTIDVNVGGVRRKAVFKGSAQTSNDGRNYRTDLTFAYTVQAGDVAFPMMIWTNENQYVVNENSFVFFNTNGLPATWRINTGSAYGDVNFDSAFFVAANVRDENLYYRNIRLQTMAFDAGNVATIEANGAKGYWTVNLGGVTSNAISVVIWTPTNLVKFGETTFASAITNTVPAGSTSFTFPIKGFVEGNGARIVVQRREAFTGISSTIPSDAISSVIDVSRAGEPSARIEWLDGSSFPESDPTDNANRKRFKIVLNQTYTNLNTDIYFRIDAVQAASGEVNVLVDPEVDGYVVRAGQTESVAYGFFAQDGSLASKSSGISLRAVATNVSYYTSMPVSKVYVNNVAPTINQPNATTTFSGWRQFVTNDLGIAWSVADVPADLATNMVFYWEMDGTLLPAQTNSVVTGNGTFKYAFTRAGMTTNKLYVVDKDGTPSLTSTFYINVEQAPRVTISTDRDSYREITNSVGNVRVTLSKTFTEDVWVKVYARYGDGTEQNNAIVGDFPMMFMIPQGEMVSDPQDFTLRDGTKDSESKRITFVPEVTNTAAKAEYKDLRTKTVSVYNTVPTISVIGGNDGVTYTNVPMGSLYAFDYEIVDSQGDLAGVFTNIWSFGAGEAVVTNVSSGARGTIKYAFTSRGTKTVSVYSYDKDGGISQTYAFQVRVVQGIPLPEVIVLQPSGAVKETDASFTYDLTVQLSQEYTETVTVALGVLEPTNYINGIIQFQTTNVTFSAGQTTAIVKFSAKDGTDYSVQHGFTVVPKVISPVAAANFYTNQVSALIFVENANPVITGPAATDIATETFAYEFTQGVQKGISWNITDVIGDKITSPASARMRVEWNFGDDSSTTTYGAAGTVFHTYTAIDDFVVTVTAFDKDGGQSGTTQFKVRVSPSKGVNVTPLGPNSASYWGVTGLGDGMVKSSEAISSTNYNNVYRFRFTSKTTAATLDAVPYKTSGTPAGYNVTNFNENGVAIVDPTRKTLNSYFFVWEGNADIFANPQNLNPATATATATIKMPASTDSTSQVDIYEVRAIFSKEFRRGDGVGDINQDGIPDGVASSIFGKIGATATTGGDTAAMPYWLTPLRSFNDDSDFLPANPTGIGGVYDFRPVAKGSGTGNTNAVSDAINAFNAYLEVRGYDGVIGAVNNVSDDPQTDPTLADSDSDGYTDGWEYYFWYAANFGDASGNKLTGSRYNPRNISEGLVIPFSEISNAFDPMRPRASWSSQYQDDFDNDGLLDIEEMLLGTNPTTWDTDNDLMCDGWEILMGLNPCDPKDGSSAMYNNIDGDYFAISSVFRQRIALVITNTTAGTVSTTTNVTTGANGSADSLTNAIYTCYYYGNATNSPLALGRKVTVDTNNVVSVTVLEDMARVLVLHFQVRDEFGFDPRTAWCDSVVGANGAVRFPLDFVAGSTPISWPTNWPGQARFGVVGTAPNTRAFTAVDEYLLLKFMRETRSDGCPDQVFARSDLWVDYSTHPLTPDTDATPQIVDGVPDGWELYVATPKGAGTGFFAFSPWSAADRNLVVNDTLQYSRKFAGTDSVAVYTNAALYAAVGPVPGVINNVAATDVALLSGVTFPVMTGVVSITRPAVDQYWLNKFWPCDPWQSDCDNDGIPDTTTDGIDERAFIYGLPVDDGSTCIAGGGLNPCAVDTDSDGLPDGWEIQFAGTLPAIGAAVAATPAVTNGMDGTYVDFASDWDADGLRNVEEYLTGAIRAWRFDRGSFYSDITKRLDETYNAAYDLFVPCTNAWDKSLLDPTDKARAYWYLLPAAQMIAKPAVLDDKKLKTYASTSPLTADSDGDGMDDYYEVFHGLNPLLGNGYIDGSDIVAEAAGVARATSYLANMNFMDHPFLLGMPQADPDADGLLNLEEALVMNTASSQNHHTDPSPMWATDISNPFSITRRFYRTLGGRISGDDAASSVMWFPPWGPAPFFYFPFEMNEGYDTDNDGISDKDEIAGSVNTSSDPLNFMSPYRRQALYFDGVQSAASTLSSYADGVSSTAGMYPDSDQSFKSFTVEMWICPERVASTNGQMLIERNFGYDASDAGEAAVRRLRANYRIGIQPNGQLFAGFDNAGGHDEHTGVAKVLGPVLKVGEWRHVALQMDAVKSRLVLYVDGAEYTSQDPKLIPANGIMEINSTGGSNSYTYVSGWLTLGAKNSAPTDLAIILNSNNIPDSVWAQTWGGFGNYYQGWMAEVRVWDGARTGTEIQNSYKLRFSMEDVRAARSAFEARLAQGARRTLPAPNNLPALLMNYYPMCDLFSSVDKSTVAMVPRGFDSSAVTTNQPQVRVVSTNSNTLVVTTNMVKMGTVQWWANAEVRSMVYTNQTYLPWIQNAVSHLPGRSHVTPGGVVTFGLPGSTMDSFYWTATTMGTTAVSNSFPNTANPYGFGYRSAESSDLLPLGSAWMRQTTNFWDKQGASASWLESAADANNDGLADWWEALNYGTTTGAGGWAALYTGNLTEFQGRGLTNGQVYRQMLAQGWTFDGTTWSKNANYKQTADSDGDGLPDWWESLYGFDTLKTTGNDGAGGDPDGDGLSNLAEYLISEVYGFRYSNPTKFKTLADQEFSDYLIKKGKLPLGFIFTDHDFIEDAWEQNYSSTFISRFLYDAHVDQDHDGWSNYAESRYSSAIRAVSPEKKSNIMVNGKEIAEFPIPVIKTTFSYAGSRTNGNLVIQTFSNPDMNGVPDAKWSVALDTITAGLTTPIGTFAKKTVKTTLSPGSLVPGTIKLSLTDMWTGLSAQTGYDLDGKLYTMPVAGLGYQREIGTVDYATGAVTFDMAQDDGWVIILDPASFPTNRLSYVACNLSYYEFSYSAKLASQWPQELYLAQPASGFVKEGNNYFQAFLDANGSGSWDPGEPMGVAAPFATNIGWDSNTLNIHLTDYTPNSPRISLTQMKRDVDGFLGAGSNGSGSGGGAANAAPSMQRVRIRRSSADVSITPTVIFDKVLVDRDYIHEGDYLAQGGYGFDWNFKGLSATFGSKYTNFVYDVYVGDGSAVDAPANVRIMSFTNILPAVHYAATPTAPLGGASVRSAYPTFRWKLPKNAVTDSYTAYCIQIKKGSASGALVWNSGTIRTPLYDRASGEYYFEAPVYMGSLLQPNTLYVWSVAGLNARYTMDSIVGTTAALQWSAWKPFRMESSVVTVPGYESLSPVNGSDYGSVGVTVKYLGPATALAGRIFVQAFTTRDFTGNPVAQATGTAAAPARGMTIASYLDSVTNQTDSTSVNAMLYGLPNGAYYVRAFLDSNANGVRDAWESWGYYNYAGMADNNIYDPRSVAVSATGITPVIMLAIEDCDTDQDFYPDAWEYEQNSAAENFLELTAPLESWDGLNDYFVINNKLNATGQFYNTAVLSLTLGSDDLVFNSVTADDGYSLASKVSAGLDPATSVSFAATGIALADNTATIRSLAVIAAPTTTTSARGSLLLNVMTPSQTTALQYVVQYTKSLATPQWVTVTEPCSVDASGMLNQVELSGDVDATSGFFRIVPYNP